MSKNSLLVSLGAIGALVVTSIFLMSNASKQERDIPKGNQATSQASGDVSETNEREEAKVVVEASEFQFKPAIINVKRGQKVTLTLKNSGTMAHDFVVDELNVVTSLTLPEETQIVEFTPEVAGSFNYYCSVSNHRQLGMEGIINVE